MTDSRFIKFGVYMGGGVSNAFHTAVAEFKLTAEQLDKYHLLYKDMEQKGLPEEHILSELKSKVKDELSVKEKSGVVSARRRPSMESRLPIIEPDSGTSKGGASVRRRPSLDGKTGGEDTDGVSCRAASTRRRPSLDGKTNSKAAAASVRRNSKEDKRVDVDVAGETIPEDTGPLPYECEICNSAFKTFEIFDQHVRMSEQHVKCVREKETALKHADRDRVLQAMRTTAKAEPDSEKPDGSAGEQTATSGSPSDASASATASGTTSERPASEVVPVESAPAAPAPAPDKVYKCEFCVTTFKTFFLLDRHIRYSDRHEKSVAEREQRDNSMERASRIANVAHRYIESLRTQALAAKADAASSHSLAWQRWHKAYKRVKMDIAIKKTELLLLESYRRDNLKMRLNEPRLLFKGSKMFWRTQEALNLYMYLHDGEDAKLASVGREGILEVIGVVAPDTEAEYEARIYLNYGAIVSLVQKELNIAKSKLKKGSGGVAGGRRKSIATSLPGGSEYARDDEGVVDEAKVTSVVNDVIGTMLVDRIQMEHIPGSAGRVRLSFTPAAKDDANIPQVPLTGSAREAAAGPSSKVPTDYVLPEDKAVTVLKPALLSLVKKSAAEIGKTIDEVNKHTIELASMTNRAERIVGMVGSSMTQVQDLAVSSRQRDKLVYSNSLRRQASENSQDSQKK